MPKVFNLSKSDAPEQYCMRYGSILALISISRVYFGLYFYTQPLGEHLKLCLEFILKKETQFSEIITLRNHEDIRLYFNCHCQDVVFAISGLLHCYYYNPCPKKASLIWLYNYEGPFDERNFLGINKKECL